MAETSSTPVPTELKLKKASRCLEVAFADGASFTLPAEYLRVHSPSAEITGHSGGEGVLVTGKQSVGIDRIEPVGRYAVKLVFDDGHDTGLFTWRILYDLGSGYEDKWKRYLERVAEAGRGRATETKVDDR